MLEKLYSSYDHVAEEATAAKAKKIEKFLKPESKALILGCGPCYEGKVLKNAGHYVIGVDAVDKYAKQNKENFDEFFKADVSKKMNFKSASFDAVIAFELIEHLAFVDPFLEECHRVLKRGGCLVLSTPSQSYWKDRVKLLVGKDILSDHHPRTFTPATLQIKLENLFTIEKMIGIGKFGLLLSTKFPLLSLCGDFIVVARKK